MWDGLCAFQRPADSCREMPRRYLYGIIAAPNTECRSETSDCPSALYRACGMPGRAGRGPLTTDIGFGCRQSGSEIAGGTRRFDIVDVDGQSARLVSEYVSTPSAAASALATASVRCHRHWRPVEGDDLRGRAATGCFPQLNRSRRASISSSSPMARRQFLMSDRSVLPA